MNYFLEITKKVEEFCNIKPYPDSRLKYLENAEKMAKLYMESMAIEGDEDEDESRLKEIYNEMVKIIG